MKPTGEAITFQKTSHQAAEFLHELNDPALVRLPHLSEDVIRQLRREQALKLEQNIATLRAKQVEFNRRMESYISNLRELVRNLESATEARRDESAGGRGQANGTHVRCTSCHAERTFHGLLVLFARDSDDAYNVPTECYVSEAGAILKGRFACRECGSEALTIRTL
jgi:hypothetical protein